MISHEFESVVFDTHEKVVEQLAFMHQHLQSLIDCEHSGFVNED
jgi:hypothetical protein